MGAKYSSHLIKGMQQDPSPSIATSEYAIDARNIRITARENTSLFSVVNEKGNYDIPLKTTNGTDATLIGNYVGHAVLNDYLVVFMHSLDYDYIYRLEKRLDYKSVEYLEVVILYKGNLGLNTSYPLETLPIFENEDIQKVYWTDGLNQPRVINIVATQDVRAKYTSTSFDFVRKLNLQEKVTINRNLVTNGIFSPGVLQYVFTYYNKYAQESNIFYTSPQYYTSFNNRGASPEDSISNSFDINISNMDYNFDYVRVYSIMRTSIDATPVCKRVIDIALPTSQGYSIKQSTETLQTTDKLVWYDGKNTYSTDTNPTGSFTVLSSYAYIQHVTSSGYTMIYNSFNEGDVINLSFTNGDNNTKVYTVNITRPSSITYTDTGTQGSTIDPTELLYVGGEEVVFGTMNQKDNTLFLGDITLKRKLLSTQLRTLVASHLVNFNYAVDDAGNSKHLYLPSASGYYPYDNQLKYNSGQIKTFKYLEHYRFGIQAQHYTGKWSEPIWVDDEQNLVPISNDPTHGSNSFNTIRLVTASTNFSSDIIQMLLDQGYVKIRPVVVYPTINDREVICQGVLCPTVYNVKDRQENAPFAQSSWFIRPNAPFDLKKSFDMKEDGTNISDMHLLGDYITTDIVSRGGILSAGRSTIKDVQLDGSTKYIPIDVSNFGDWAEFRHNYPIPDNMSRHAEIQSITSPPSNPYIQYNEDNLINDYINSNKQNYYVDQSILTFHSPDIEFDPEVRSLDSSNLKLRIVGVVPLTSFYSDIELNTSTPVLPFKGTSDLPNGFYKERMSSQNLFNTPGSLGIPTKLKSESNFGWRGCLASPMWFDEVYASTQSNNNTDHKVTGFVVYPWHRSGSMNNQKNGEGDSKYRYSLLQKKQMSNIRFSYNTFYLYSNNLWNAYIKDSTVNTGISGVNIFDSDQISVTRIKAQENSGLQDINYYGNIDKLLIGNYSGSSDVGYPIAIGGSMNGSSTDIHSIFSAPKYKSCFSLANAGNISGTDPIRIKYKSTAHAVLALNYAKDGSQRVLPTAYDNSYYYGTSGQTWAINNVGGNFSDVTGTESEVAHYDDMGQPIYEDHTVSYNVWGFWDKKHITKSVSQDTLNVGKIGDSSEGTIQYGWLWLGELYNDSVTNRFGGKTEEAFENNKWLPCGNPVSLKYADGTTKTSVNVIWSEGDTYYQRYDNLKTFPFTNEDINQVTDIVSFMVETRVNLDGRYDRNRGQTSNITMSPTNFNLMNNVYSQKNNFFTYNTINPNKLNLDNFHNSITWTKSKTMGDLIDTWTNITMASTLDLDGDKGIVRALKKFNNEIYAFQDRGISNILFNSRTQLSSADGVPIEIANSGKVDGKRYIATNLGCANKWSINETSNGIYFADKENNSVYLFNGQFSSLTDKFGFRKWLGDQTPYFNNFRTYCDKNNSDIYFNVNNGNSSSQCLCFSEFLNQFTSFMSYTDVDSMFNIGSDFYAIKNNKIWHNFKGEYNMFFGTFQPFSLTVISNQDENLDKIYNNIEFRSDTFYGQVSTNNTFDTLDVWNEYQHGTMTLTNTKDKPSSLKRKFRVWRTLIPRDNTNSRDRIRGTWAYVKLAMNNPNTFRTQLYDLNVHFFE